MARNKKRANEFIAIVLLALLGIPIGLAASLALTRILKNLLFSRDAADPVTIGAIALLACWIPARHETKVDRLIALRRE